MDTETVAALASAVVAAFAAGVAVVAAVWSKNSADRSAAAEERSARAAEDALAIERDRRRDELEDRAAETAPRLDLGEKHGVTWTLAQGGTMLVGYVYNAGPGPAVVEEVWWEGPGEPARADLTEALLAEGDHLRLLVPWPASVHPTVRPSLRVVFHSGSGTGYRAELRYELARANADANGQPLFRPGRFKLVRLA